MLFLDAYRVLRRTYNTAFRRPKAAPPAPPPDMSLRRTSGLFSTPVGAAMFTGTIAAAINLIPMCCLNWNIYNAPLAMSGVVFVSLTVLLSAPCFVFRSPGHFGRALRFAFVLTILALILPFLAFALRVYPLRLHYAELSALVRVLGSLLIGGHLARVYGLPNQWKKYGWLSVLGSAPVIGYEIYVAYLMRVYPKGYSFSKEEMAFIFMALLLGSVGVVVVPSLGIEAEMKHKMARS